MKKLTLLTVLLLALGLTLGFAQEVKPTVTLTGSATLTAGIDLNDMSTGFSNAAAAALTVNLVGPDLSFTKAGEGAIFGSITISNVELFWSTAAETYGPAATDVAAKIVAGPIAIGIYNVPTLSADSVAGVEVTADDVVDAEGSSVKGSYTKFGTWVSYTMAPIDIKVKIMSGDDWLLNNLNSYAFGLDGTLTLTPITVTFGGYKGINYAVGSNPLLAYVTVAAALAPITASLKFDANMGDAVGATFDFDIGVGLRFDIDTAKTVYVTADVAYGPGFDGTAGGASDLDIKLYFMEPAAGLIPDLNFDLTAYILDLMGTNLLEYEVLVNGGYKMMLDKVNYAKPFASVIYGNPNNSTIDVLKLTVGVELALFPKTVITAKYASGNLMLTTGGLGAFTVATVITY